MPKKICNQINCNTLIPMSERYCSDHKRDVSFKKHKQYDKNKRNRSHHIFYVSSGWKKAREASMQRTGGLCEECMKFDLVVKADVVDHIIPISQDYSKRLDQENLMPLCHSHHNKKTAYENSNKGGGL